MNGYFRLINENGKNSIKLIPPVGDGKQININDVLEYLTMKDYTCDLPALRKAVETAAEEETVLLLNMEKRFAERECYKLTVSQDKMQAYAKFYAASEGGENMTVDEMLKDLELKGIRVGIKQEAIAGFFAKREYCEDILIAEGIMPKQGTHAHIEYYFNTDKKAKPTLREDGSVDFFNLNILNHCEKGETLAKLFPAIPGEPGKTLFGETIKPNDVREETLRYGNNIALSEDGTTLTSTVDGHVELVEGQVFVSDVLVVENVDNSTGNIDYDGTVQVNGNVCTNFAVKAHGDIIVKGVVEGAVLEADGNIIIARGMNGMGKGSLYAKGNIVAKFLENSKAQAEGYVSSESILHSQVMAGTEVTVDGRRGFITGGKVTAAKVINVKTLGSEMGGDTTVEVGADPNIKTRIAELQKQIAEETKALQMIQPVLVATKQKIAQGVKFTPEQLQHVQSLAQANKQKTELIEKCNAELDGLMKQASGTEGVEVIVRDRVYPGTRICIGDVSMVVQKATHYCKFVKERGDVKMAQI